MCRFFFTPPLACTTCSLQALGRSPLTWRRRRRAPRGRTCTAPRRSRPRACTWASAMWPRCPAARPPPQGSSGSLTWSLWPSNDRSGYFFLLDFKRYFSGAFFVGAYSFSCVISLPEELVGLDRWSRSLARPKVNLGSTLVDVHRGFLCATKKGIL